MPSRYDAGDPEAEFEPGSRGRVLRNLLGLRRVSDMEQAESEALVATQEALLDEYTLAHRFTAADICAIHRQWLGGIYPWAGEYRNVNIAKGDLLFAAASQIPRLMAQYERNELCQLTPCEGMSREQVISALARTHAELVIIHPFREGNGRCARLLAWLMALQAGLPSLDFAPLAGRGRPAYFAAVRAALASNNYAPMEARFAAVIRRSLQFSEGAP